MFNNIILTMPLPNVQYPYWTFDNCPFDTFSERGEGCTYSLVNLFDKDLYLSNEDGNTIFELSPEEALISAFEVGAFLSDPLEIEVFFAETGDKLMN
jgi:hypothetical protein